MARVIRNAGAGSARRLGTQLLAEGLRTRDRADELHIETILNERGKADKISESLNDFARYQADQRRRREEARAGKKSAAGGVIGTAVGVVAGVLLAPATGGASLALLAGAVGGGVGAAIGSGIGSLAEDSPGAGQRATAQIGQASRQLGAVGQAGLNRAAAKDIATTRDQGRTEQPLDAFFMGAPDESEFGFEEGPAVEAGKTAGINDLAQKAPEKAPNINLGFGLEWDPTTGEALQSENGR